MTGRTHRHRVPTARPPAAGRGILYLWGRGEVGSDLRNYFHDEHASIAQHDDIARELAREHGCPIDIVHDAWAWRVEGASTAIVDLMSRDDPHVLGWTAYKRAACPPSLALRNSLNALTSEELSRFAGLLCERFCKAGSSAAGGSSVWIARDNRKVVFDAEKGRWRLADYSVV